MFFNLFKLNFFKVPVVVHKKTQISPDLKQPIEESLTVLDNYLKENQFIASKHLTIADFSIVPSVTTAKVRIEFYINESF